MMHKTSGNKYCNKEEGVINEEAYKNDKKKKSNIIKTSAYYTVQRKYNYVTKKYENIVTFYSIDGNAVDIMTMEMISKNDKRVAQFDKMLDYKCTNNIRPSKIVLIKLCGIKYVLIEDKNKIIIFRAEYTTDKLFDRETFINYQLNECDKPIDMDYCYIANGNVPFIDKTLAIIHPINTIKPIKSTGSTVPIRKSKSRTKTKSSNGSCTII